MNAQLQNLWKFNNIFNIKLMISKGITQNVLSGMERLGRTVDNIADTKMLAISYYLKTQELYSDLSQKFTIQVEEADRQLIEKFTVFPECCEEILAFTKISKKLSLYLESMGSLNLSDVKAIDQSTKWFQSKLKNKIEDILKEVTTYGKKEQSYNLKYSSYQIQCNRLSQKLNKTQGCEEPIRFYDPNLENQPSKNLDKELNLCENIETSLLSQLLILDDRRKFMALSLAEIKQEFLALLHLHLQGLCNTITSLVSEAKDEQINNKVKAMVKMFQIQQGFLQAGVERFQGRESIMRGETSLVDHYDMFKKLNRFELSDCVIFMDQCTSFYNKKYKKSEDLIEIQKIFVSSAKKFRKYIEQIEEGFKKINKDLYKSYGVINFKKRLYKYFGSNMVSLFDLSLAAVENSKRRLQKIGKILENNQEKMVKLVFSKEEQLKKFKKRMNAIFEQHQNLRSNFGKKQFNYQQIFEKNYQYIEKICQELTQNQRDFDEAFFQQLKRITSLIRYQAEQSELKAVFKKEKQQRCLQILKKLELHTEILAIFKEDQRYDIFFDSSVHSNLSEQFVPLINRKRFEERKKILQKKQYLTGEKTFGCCGLSEARKISHSSILSEYPGSVINSERLLKEGMIQITRNGLRFKQKSWNPFYQEVELVIPKSQIIDYSQAKNKKIQLSTKMGSLIFVCKNAQQLQNQLKRNFKTRRNTRELDNSSSNPDNNNSSSLSWMRSNTTEYKIAYESQNCETRDRTSKIMRPNDYCFTKELKQHLQSTQLFSSVIEQVCSEEKEGKVRRDYIFEQNMIKFLVKERASYKSFNQGKKQFIYLNFEWKICFPQMPMLKSFHHSESARIELTPAPNQIKMIIIEKTKKQEVLFTRSKFYNEVKIMNKRLSEILSEFCERDTQVLVEEEKQQENHSINFDIEQSVIEKKPSSESRNSKLFTIQLTKDLQ